MTDVWEVCGRWGGTGPKQCQKVKCGRDSSFKLGLCYSMLNFIKI